jgi:hypothetical protein
MDYRYHDDSYESWLSFDTYRSVSIMFRINANVSFTEITQNAFVNLKW